MPDTQKIIPVILSGGSGTRLWPLSRDSLPKQFIGIMDEKTPIIRETINRVVDPGLFLEPLVVGKEEHRFLMAEQMRLCGFENPHILIEPVARNTGPAMIAAALYLQREHKDALMLVLPTDHVIADTKAFLAGVKQAGAVARQGYLVTFGIKPDHPETGYGYIRLGAAMKKGKDSYEIASFIEKPNEKKAKEFIASGEYLWNSGMFMFPVELLLSEMKKFQPAMVEQCVKALGASVRDLDFTRLDKEAFGKAEKISVDHALMERTNNAAVVALDCGWSDTGAWDLLWAVSPKNDDGNVMFGDCYVMDTQNSYLRSERGQAIAALGVEDLIVVAMRDAVLVADKSKAQSLKELVELIKKRRPLLTQEDCKIYRPWGSYENIYGGDRFKVKRLTVKPGQKLSLQMHYHRAEHWIVVSGTGKMTCDDMTKIVTENQSFYVPCGSVHSIENPAKIDLDIIEVQSGSYFGEDDIVRFEDRYGRKDS